MTGEEKWLPSMPGQMKFSKRKKKEKRTDNDLQNKNILKKTDNDSQNKNNNTFKFYILHIK